MPSTQSAQICSAVAPTSAALEPALATRKTALLFRSQWQPRDVRVICEEACSGGDDKDGMGEGGRGFAIYCYFYNVLYTPTKLDKLSIL